MGFLDFFRPRWRHSEFEVRAQAVRDLPDDEQTTLAEVATKDPDPRVRRIAVKRLCDPTVLRQIADSDEDQQLRQTAAEKASQLLLDEALEADDGHDPLPAVAQLTDAKDLATVVKRTSRADVRDAALAKLSDGRALVDVALRAQEPGVRLAAVAKLREPGHLREVARDADHKGVATAALERIDEPGALDDIAKNGKIKAVRTAARDRLPAPGSPKDANGSAQPAKAGQMPAPSAKKAPGRAPAEIKRLRARQLSVVVAVEPLCKSSTDWAHIDRAIADAREAWAEVGDVPGTEDLEKRFEAAVAIAAKRRSAWEHDREVAAHKAREAEARRRRDAEAAEAEAKQKAEAAQQHEAEAARRAKEHAERDAKRAAEQAARTERVPAPVDPQAELSLLATRAERLLERERIGLDKVEELEGRWAQLDREGLDATKTQSAQPPAAPATAPTVAAAEVAPPAPAIPAPPILPSAQPSVDDGWDVPAPAAEAPASVAAPAPAPEAPAPAHPFAPLRARLAAALGTLRARAERVAHEAEAARAQAKRELERLADRLEQLKESTDLKKIDGALKQARGLLKEGRGLEAELRARVTAALDGLTERAGQLRDAEGWRRWANLPKFEQLIKEAETLVEILDTIDDKRRAPAVLKELQQRWKDAGSLPQEQSQKLWERFKKACDTAYEKSKAFYAKLDEARPENLVKKTALAEKAEALAAQVSAETLWKDASAAMKALQDEWKQIGPVPDADRVAVWKRFRGACDAFFAKRDEHDRERDAAREENLAQKRALCSEAERLATSTDWRAAAEAIKELQERWKDVGPVPKAEGDALWKRFRGACDQFFAARKAAFEAQDGERAQNLLKKQKLVEDAEALVASAADDPPAAEAKAKDLQREWKKIGQVPREHADAIWDRFRAAVDRVFNPPVEPLPPEVEGKVGIGGFVNRLNLAGVAEKLAAARSPEPAAANPTAATPTASAAPAPESPAPLPDPDPDPAPAPIPAPTAAPVAAADPVADADPPKP